MKLKTKIIKKAKQSYEYDVVQQLKYQIPVIIKIANNDKDKFGDGFPASIIGKTFMAQRTGSHSLQPIIPFGEWFYNIYANNLESLLSLEFEPTEYLKAEKALMPVVTRDASSWYKKGKLHREDDLPAKIHTSGSQYWYRHGEIQRTGFKPAVVNAQGNHWYYKGKPADEEFMKFIRANAPEYFV